MSLERSPRKARFECSRVEEHPAMARFTYGGVDSPRSARFELYNVADSPRGAPFTYVASTFHDFFRDVG